MDKVTPTQADIQAAKRAADDLELESWAVEAGYFASRFVQAFARHAEQARREQIERDATIAESEQYAQPYVDATYADGSDRPIIYNEACLDIAQAIRGQSNGTD